MNTTIGEHSFVVTGYENLLEVTRAEKIELSHDELQKRKNRKRGEITDFSAKSRSRFIQKLNRISRTDVPYIQTLTYHRSWPETFEGWKLHLNQFTTKYRWSFFNLYEDAAAAWRLEFQTRLTPHYHLVTWFDEEQDLEELQVNTARTWARVTGENHPEALEHATQVELVDTHRGALWYLVGGHLSKRKQVRSGIKTGRVWGFNRPEKLGMNDQQTRIELTPKQYCFFRRVARRYLANHGASDHYLNLLRSDFPVNMNLIMPQHLQRRVLEPFMNN